jgi:hypothetical protein
MRLDGSRVLAAMLTLATSCGASVVAGLALLITAGRHPSVLLTGRSIIMTILRPDLVGDTIEDVNDPNVYLIRPQSLRDDGGGRCVFDSR